MNALNLLKQDHDVLKEYLEMAEEDGHEKRTSSRESSPTSASTKASRSRSSTPRSNSHPKAKDMVLESYQEHHVVDMLLRELETMPTTDGRRPAKLKVLKENVEHHIEEEEGEMFHKARSVFDKTELEALGTRMDSMKAARPDRGRGAR